MAINVSRRENVLFLSLKCIHGLMTRYALDGHWPNYNYYFVNKNIDFLPWRHQLKRIYRVFLWEGKNTLSLNKCCRSLLRIKLISFWKHIFRRFVYACGYRCLQFTCFNFISEMDPMRSHPIQVNCIIFISFEFVRSGDWNKLQILHSFIVYFGIFSQRPYNTRWHR